MSRQSPSRVTDQVLQMLSCACTQAEHVLALFSISNFTKIWSLQTCILVIKFGIAKGISEGGGGGHSFSNYDFIPKVWNFTFEKCTFLINNKHSERNDYRIRTEQRIRQIYPSFHIDLSFALVKFEGHRSIIVDRSSV